LVASIYLFVDSKVGQNQQVGNRFSVNEFNFSIKSVKFSVKKERHHDSWCR